MGKLYCGSQSIIHCANCGGKNLHAFAVELFVRSEEFSNEGFHVLAKSDGTVEINKNMASNFNLRGGTASILFRCEDCPTITAALALHHNGTETLNLLTVDPDDLSNLNKGANNG